MLQAQKSSEQAVPTAVIRSYTQAGHQSEALSCPRSGVPAYENGEVQPGSTLSPRAASQHLYVLLRHTTAALCIGQDNRRHDAAARHMTGAVTHRGRPSRVRSNWMGLNARCVEISILARVPRGISHTKLNTALSGSAATDITGALESMPTEAAARRSAIDDSGEGRAAALSPLAVCPLGVASKPVKP